MSDFQIRKNIPVPAVTRDTKYPWADMEDGDSIVFPEEQAQAAAQSARLWVNRHRPEFSVVTRTLDSGELGIWFQLSDGEATAEEE